MSGARVGLVRGSMMIATSLFIAGVLALVISIVLARTVGVEEFGHYSITASLQNTALVFSSFGMGTAVAKYVSEYGVRDERHAVRFARTGLRLVMLFSIITAIVYFALADPLGNDLYGEPAVAQLIPFSALVVISGALVQLTQGIARGTHRLTMLSAMQVSVPVINLGIIVALLPYVGIRIAFIGLFTAQFAVVSAAMVRLRQSGFSVGLSVTPDEDVRCGRMLLSFAVPAVLCGAMVGPIYWLGNTVLALESGFAAVGNFAVAMVFYNALAVLPTSLMIPLVPRISEMSVQARGQIEALVSRSVKTVAVVVFPVFLAVALFSKLAVDILYGVEFSGAYKTVFLMVIACYLVALSSSISATISGLGRMWVLLGLDAVWAFLVVSTALFTVPWLGPTGLGLSYVMAYGIYLVSSVAISDRFLNIRIRGVAPIAVIAVSLFAIGFTALDIVWSASMFARLLFLVVGAGAILLMGRREVRTVVERALGF